MAISTLLPASIPSESETRNPSSARRSPSRGARSRRKRRTATPGCRPARRAPGRLSRVEAEVVADQRAGSLPGPEVSASTTRVSRPSEAPPCGASPESLITRSKFRWSGLMLMNGCSARRHQPARRWRDRRVRWSKMITTGKPIRARVPAGEKLLPLFGVCCVELERHPAARPQVPDLVRRADHLSRRRAPRPGAVCAPLVQELRYDPVERLRRGMPRLDNVVVDLPERCRPQKGLSYRAVALRYEQLGVG